MSRETTAEAHASSARNALDPQRSAGCTLGSRSDTRGPRVRWTPQRWPAARSCHRRGRESAPRHAYSSWPGSVWRCRAAGTARRRGGVAGGSAHERDRAQRCQTRAFGWVVEKLRDRRSRLVDAIHEQSANAVGHLQRDTAHVPGDHRRALPRRFGDYQPEALPGRLLDDDIREALEGVDLDVADAGQVGEDVHEGVVAALGHDPFVDGPALRIVQRHRSDEGELHIRVPFPRGTIGGQDAERVLPGVEP